MIEQAGIAVTGAVAIWLSQAPSYRAQAWAPIVGLIGQPFWIWAALESAQWGILAVTVLYTAGWVRGIYRHWLTP